MLIPPLPADEPQRLAALRALDLLDTPQDERYDRLTGLARYAFDVPIALLSLVDADRQWFKSRQGLDSCETPRSVSFCGHAVLADKMFIVEDAQADPRFADNPLVLGPPHVRFYAGRPLHSADGHAVGTLCIIDRKPRQFQAADRHALDTLGAVVESTMLASQLAMEDCLTGLPNRRGFERLAAQALAVCQREHLAVSLMFFDLDGFKAINDHDGHEAGDQALQTFARLLASSVRGTDICARLGGDEFVVLQTGVQGDAGQAAVRRLESAVAEDNRHSSRSQPLRFSVGTVSHPQATAADLPDLMAQADARMYAHKARASAPADADRATAV